MEEPEISNGLEKSRAIGDLFPIIPVGDLGRHVGTTYLTNNGAD